MEAYLASSAVEKEGLMAMFNILNKEMPKEPDRVQTEAHTPNVVSHSSHGATPKIPVSDCGPLFSIDDENKRNIGSAPRISREIFLLMKHGVRPPISLFMTQSLRMIDREATSLRKKRTTEDNVVVHLLDITAFPDEASVTFIQWTDCWRGFLRFLNDPGVEHKVIHDRWQTHFNMLAGIEDVSDPAHDIEERAMYFKERHTFDAQDWWLRFGAIRETVLRKRMQGIEDSMALLGLFVHPAGPVPGPSKRLVTIRTSFLSREQACRPV
ncbi:hypothetical protein OF83DRAFT_1089188, partial [Amylostereum chailletii]